jgi:hypothetical protein
VQTALYLLRESVWITYVLPLRKFGIGPQQKMDGAFDFNLLQGTRGYRDEIDTFENKFWEQMASPQSLLPMR